MEDEPVGTRAEQSVMLGEAPDQERVHRYASSLGQVPVLERAPFGVLVRVEPAG